MKLTLAPDPGTGRHWRLTLHVGDLELCCDVAERDDSQAADRIAHDVAIELGLDMSDRREWRPCNSARNLAVLAWFCSRGATGAGQWPGDPDDFAKQTKAREEFDAWWRGR